MATKKSQEVTGKEAQELPEVDKTLVDEFLFLDNESLDKYEASMRDKISDASKAVRDAFDEKWRDTYGTPYYQPITNKPPIQRIESTDPKTNGYEGFYEVIFAAKQNPNDPNEVMLGCNGNCLQIKRMEKVILPGYFLEIADHGQHPTFSQMPGQDRKISGYIKIFPYSVIRMSDEKEYQTMLADGNKKTRDAREKRELA